MSANNFDPPALLDGYENLDDNDEHPEDEDGDEEHQWGPVERAFITGNPHRKCQFPGCKMITLDLSDDDDDDDESGN